MIKFKTTKKAMMDQSNHIIKLGYCAAQHLLNYYNPIAYTSGVYGWNSDIYFINGHYISTGYRPFGTIIPPYELVNNYDEQARAIVNDWNKPYDNRKHEIELLVTEFFNELYGVTK